MRIRQMLIGALALACACAFGAGTNELSVKAGDPLASARMMRLRNALKAGTHTGPETATEKTRKAIAKLFPGWSLDTEVYDHDWAGIQSYHRGKRNVTFVHPKNKGTPSVISRTVKLSGNNPCLSLSVASLNDDADFLLSVRVNGKDALSNRIVCTTDAVPWEDIVVPLSDWRGSTVKIEVVFTANGWSCEFPYLARVDIIEADGDMSVKEGKCEVDGYTWSYRVQNGEATIVAENYGRFSAVSPCPVGSITIPATLAGAKVTHIGKAAFLDCSAMTSVTVPEGVLRIGRGAFRDCTGLKSIKIPGSVKFIERAAFAGCYGLTSVSIPEGVTIIDRGVFHWCCGLGSIEIPSSITQIGREAFFCCRGLTSATIPGKVMDIGLSAFRGCTALASVTIPASVTNIDSTAFCDTGALKSFQVEPGNRFYKSENGLLLTKDGTTLVRGVNGDAAIPPSVTAVGPCAFEGCAALRSAVIPSGVKSVGPFAFKQCRGATSVTIPSSVTDIGREAFSNCKGLKSIAIPQGITVIRNSTFSSTALTEVVIPANVKDLERGAFSWCGELKSVAFHEGLTSIGRDAFYNCGKLTSLTIPSSVQRIDQGAFHGCGSLTSVTMRGERPNAPNDVFKGCSKLKLIHVSANAKSWAGMKKWQDVPLVFDGTVETELPYEVVDGAVVLGNGMASGPRFRSRVAPRVDRKSATAEISSGELVIPDAIDGIPVRGIGYGAFSDCNGLVSVRIPDGVTSIAAGAFYGCNDSLFDTKTIPGVKLVDGWAVGNTGSLSGDLNLTGVRGIANSAFSGCSGLTDVTIPNGVASVGRGAFSGCIGLESVAISESVTNIGENAFGGGGFSAPFGMVVRRGNKSDEFSGLKSFSVDADNPSYSSRNGMLCAKDGSILIAGVDGDVIIPEGVASIGNGAFSGRSGLTSVSIPNGVTNIGSSAFSGCRSLVCVSIPSSVSNIWSSTFSGCSSLASVTIPNGVANIGFSAFYGCRSLTSVAIPDSVTNICEGAGDKRWQYTHRSRRRRVDERDDSGWRDEHRGRCVPWLQRTCERVNPEQRDKHRKQCVLQLHQSYERDDPE